MNTGQAIAFVEYRFRTSIERLDRHPDTHYERRFAGKESFLQGHRLEYCAAAQ